MTHKRLIKITQSNQIQKLDQVPVNFRRLRVSKLLIKTEAPYDDDDLHCLTVDFCGYAQHKTVNNEGSLQRYSFSLPFNGCEKGLTSYQNLNDGWDWVGSNYSNNSIDLEINTYIDGDPANLTNPIIIELEFSN
jgi:hypothetical protein